MVSREAGNSAQRLLWYFFKWIIRSIQKLEIVILLQQMKNKNTTTTTR